MKHLTLLLAGLLMLSFFVALYFNPIQNPVGLGSDGYEYWHLSTNILQKKQFAYSGEQFYPLLKLKPFAKMGLVPNIIPCTTRAPGYPVILSLARMLWDSPWAAIIINYLFYIGICIYGFLLGNLLISDLRWRWIYNFLLTFSPLYFTRWGISSDFCAGFLATAFTYSFMRIMTLTQIPDPRQKHSGVTTRLPRYHLFWTSLLGLLACLTRSNLVLYIYPLIILGFLYGAMKKDKQIVINALVLLVFIGVCLNAWMVRNQRLTDQRTLSTQGGFVLYTVHLGYDHPKEHGLPADLFVQSLKSGKTINQTEAIVDQKLKNMVLAHYREHPFEAIKKEIDGIRTLFLFSYFDISDTIVLAQKSFTKRMAFVNSSSSEYSSYTHQELLLRNILFQMSRLYKWVLMISFFAFPFIFLIKKGSFPSDSQAIMLFYVSTLIGVLCTALCTGAGGDRLRLPFNAFILIFVVFSWMMLASRGPHKHL